MSDNASAKNLIIQVAIDRLLFFAPKMLNEIEDIEDAREEIFDHYANEV